jgi:hypothetical protein
MMALQHVSKLIEHLNMCRAIVGLSHCHFEDERSNPSDCQEDAISKLIQFIQGPGLSITVQSQATPLNSTPGLHNERQ